MLLRKTAKVVLFTLGGLLAFVLLLMLALKLVLDRVPAYQAQIKEWVHAQSGYHINFRHVSPAFRWYGPLLYFEQVELRSKDNERVLARAAGARVALDIRKFVSTGKFLAGRLEFDAPTLTIVRTGPNTFAIASEIVLGQGSALPDATLDDLPAGEVAIRRGNLTLQNWNEALPRLPLRDVSLDITHGEAELTLAAFASLPPVLGGNLSVRANAEGLGDVSRLHWNAFARARGIAFTGWRKLLPDFLDRLESGTGDFVVAAHGSGAVLARADLEFAAQGITTQVRDGPGNKFDSLSGAISLVHVGDQWSLAGRRVRASHAGRQDPDADFDIAWNANADGLLAMKAHANYLHADTLLPLAGLLPQQDLRERLQALGLTGEWTDTDLSMSRSLLAEPWRLDIRAKFRDVGFAPVGRAPGLRGLTGQIEGTQSGGHLVFNSPFAVLTWPGQFSQPVELQNLATTLYWRRDTRALLVATPQFSFKTPDAGARGKFAWEAPLDGSSPIITLAAMIENGNAAATQRYLPMQSIAPSAYAWLSRAFPSGQVTHADAVIRGPISQFPFRDGGGSFLVRANIADMTLDYQEGWQPITDLALQVEFRNQGMSVRDASGRLGDLRLSGGEARFADFRSGELEVQVNAAGDAAAALDYLRATPLDGIAEHAFSAVDAKGDVAARVSLFFPFKQFERRKTEVHLQLDDVALSRHGSSLGASAISGDADIEGAQVARADVRGRVLNGPFQMTARAARARPLTRTQLDFRGTLSGEALHDALAMPASVPLRGTTDWHAVLKLAPEPARERSIRVTSNLAGVELKLPSPLAKAAAAQLPTAVEITYPANAAPQARFNLGPVLSGSFSLESEPGGVHLGHIALNLGNTGAGGGSGDSAANDVQTLNVSGSLEQVDLAGWLKLIPPPDKNSKPLASYFRGARINVARLDYIGLSFLDLAIDLSTSDTGLKIAIGGPNVVGVIGVPSAQDAGAPWSMQFDRLRFVEQQDDETSPASTGGDASSVATPGVATPGGDPRAIPSINFHAAQLIWGDRQFGDVQAVLSKVDDGIVLKQMAVTSGVFTAHAHGEWRGRDAGSARLAGGVDSTDVGATLKQLGYKKVMEAKTGHAEFNVDWSGAPTADSLSQARGHVQLAMEKGQIVGLDPGAGRVLGLTSFAALPRRLALDFSDLTDKGFAFDTAKGDFELRDGNAYTENVLVKGPAAEIGLIGRIGLKNRDYDQTVVVTGNLGNSPLPLAGFVGGPVVGAAFLVFSQVFKQPLKGLARGYYRITGGWDSPTVERIKNTDAAASSAEAPK